MVVLSGEPDIAWGSSTERRHLVDYTAERLAALCRSAGFSTERKKIVGTYRNLLQPWGKVPPVKLSVAIEGQRAEVRALFEPQADAATLGTFRAVALRFHERLEREYQADLTRFRLLDDLFLPDAMSGRFAPWSSVVFAHGAAPAFKTYFNAHARGVRHAATLVELALQRLGMPQAMSSLRATALRRGPGKDELRYFALDLTSTRQARVKVYTRHHDSTPQELELACSAARSYVPGEALELVREMSSTAMMRLRAPFTCSSFTAESDDPRPASTTLYVPVCAYARDGGAVHQRVRDYMFARDIDPRLYDSIIDGFANRPADAGLGMRAWFAFGRHHGKARFTVYRTIIAT